LVGIKFKEMKGYNGEDIHEGKMSLIVIYCVRKWHKREEVDELLSILKEKSVD
jgi:hypothetical protein